jgi:hypothetical protein
MSSLFVQVTVAPTGTVSVCGPKTKLSIFTSALAAEPWSIAATLGDPADNSITAIITGAAKPATHPFFLVIFCFLSSLIFLAWSSLFGPDSSAA